jgi:hypothetical protein
VSSETPSFLSDLDNGLFASRSVTMGSRHYENTLEDAEPPIRQFYRVLTLMGSRLSGVADGVVESPTSADVLEFLTHDLSFSHRVVATTCIGSDTCLEDPRSFRAFGTATFREMEPIPEPATISLLGLGLLTGAAVRRLRRSRL